MDQDTKQFIRNVEHSTMKILSKRARMDKERSLKSSHAGTSAVSPRARSSRKQKRPPSPSKRLDSIGSKKDASLERLARSMDWDGTVKTSAIQRAISQRSHKTGSLPPLSTKSASATVGISRAEFLRNSTTDFARRLKASPLKRAKRRKDHMATKKKKVKIVTRRAEHAVQKSHCKACWSNPSVIVGTERNYGHTCGRPSHEMKEAKREIAQALQQQGPKSWGWLNLRKKYRDEKGRTAAWKASVAAQNEAERKKEELGVIVPVVVVTRHPLHADCERTVLKLNKESVERSLARNKLKTFSLSMQEVWRAHPPELPSNSEETKGRCLSSRWDLADIESGNHQVQSVSLKRALSTAIVSPLELLTRSVRNVQMARLSRDFVTKDENGDENGEENSDTSKTSMSADAWIPVAEYDVHLKDLWFEIEDEMKSHGVGDGAKPPAPPSDAESDVSEMLAFLQKLDPSMSVAATKSESKSDDGASEDACAVEVKSASSPHRGRKKKRRGMLELDEDSDVDLSSDEEEAAFEASAEAAKIAARALADTRGLVENVAKNVAAMSAAKTAAFFANIATTQAFRVAAFVAVDGWRIPPPQKGCNDTRQGLVKIYLSEKFMKVELHDKGSERCVSTVLARSAIREVVRNDPQRPANGEVDIADYVVERLRIVRPLERDTAAAQRCGEMQKTHEEGRFLDADGNLIVSNRSPPPTLIFDDNHPRYTPNAFWCCGRTEMFNAVPGTTVLGIKSHKKQGVHFARSDVSNEEVTVHKYKFLSPQLVNACFRQSEGGRSDAVIVNVSASLEVPLLHPFCGAWSDELCVPAPLLHTPYVMPLSKKMCPYHHRVLQSLVDAWRPSPCAALNDAETLADADALVPGHLRWSPIRDENGFRIVRVFHLSQVDPELPVRTFGVSEPAVVPNAPCAWPRRYSYHLDYVCTELTPYWSKLQTMTMLRANDAAGANVPLLFTTHMSEYNCRKISKIRMDDLIAMDKRADELLEAQRAKEKMASALDRAIDQRKRRKENAIAMKRGMEYKDEKRRLRRQGKVPKSTTAAEWIRRAKGATVIGRQKIRTRSEDNDDAKIREVEWVKLQKDDLVFFREEGRLRGLGYQWDPPLNWIPIGLREPSSARSEASHNPKMSLAPPSVRSPNRTEKELMVMRRRDERRSTSALLDDVDDHEEAGATKKESTESVSNANEESNDAEAVAGYEMQSDESATSSSEEEDEEDGEWKEEGHSSDEEDVPEKLDDLMHTLVKDERFLGEVARRFGMKLPKEPLPTHAQYRIGMRVEARLGGGAQWWPCTVADILPDGSMDLVYDLPNTAEQRVEPEFVRTKQFRTKTEGKRGRRMSSSTASQSRRRRHRRKEPDDAFATKSEESGTNSTGAAIPPLRLEDADIPGFVPRREAGAVPRKRGMQARDEREEVLQLLSKHDGSGGKEEERIVHQLHVKHWRLMRANALPKGFVTNALDTHTAKPHASSNITQAAERSMPGMFDPAEDSYQPIPDILTTRTDLITNVMADTLKYAIKQKQTEGGGGGGGAATKMSGPGSPDAALGVQLDDEKDDPEIQMAEWTKKCFTAVRNASLAEVEEYLDYGVLAQEAVDEHGNTLLHIAVQQGLKGISKLLLRRLADINAKNLAGNTPLHYAFAYGFEPLGEYLISKGANPTIQNAQGLTCYEGLHMDDLENL